MDIDYSELTYTADFVAQEFIADQGSCTLDLSGDPITFESADPDRELVGYFFEAKAVLDHNIKVVSNKYDDLEEVYEYEFDFFTKSTPGVSPSGEG